MHILGYRVEAVVLVVAGWGLVAATLLGVILRRRGVTWRHAVATAVFAWTVAIVLVASLAPDTGRAGAGTCSLELPASSPWSSDQRTLNVVMYVPVALLGVFVVDRGRHRAALIGSVLGLAVLVELLQQTHVVGRSCDLVDVLDNWMGAALGAVIGTVVFALGHLARRGSEL